MTKINTTEEQIFLNELDKKLWNAANNVIPLLMSLKITRISSLRKD